MCHRDFAARATRLFCAAPIRSSGFTSLVAAEQVLTRSRYVAASGPPYEAWSIAQAFARQGFE
jgi:hypothetical protein